MSAIAGIIYSSTDDLRFISSMTDLLAHRGPQGDGTLWFMDDGSTRQLRNALPSTTPIPGRAVLGHRQLGTIGDAATQPLTEATARYWITMDGALYNYRELRETLKTKGHRFTTDSDAEVALAAYAEHGMECFQHFNGPWAMAILDTQERSLLLARDPAGQRPLYYWGHRSGLAFASEIKALFALPEIRPKMERPSIDDFLRFGSTSNPQKTSFAHIQALAPGHAVLVPLDTPAQVKPLAYTQASAPDMPGSDADTVAAFRDLFFAAIERQRQSPFEVGTCLTGGVASTAIACALRQQLGADVMFHSFTAMTDTPGHDERTWVIAANSATHTLSNLVVPLPEDFMAELDLLLWHHDEPFADTSSYGQWCVARAAREAQIPVLFDGHGAGTGFTPAAKPSLMQKLLQRDGRDENRLLAKLSMGMNMNNAAPEPLAAVLRRGDRSSMAFGVELRTPYLDQSLAAFTRRLPAAQMHNNQLLRRALGDLLPEPILNRAHSPAFRLPMAEWVQNAIMPAFLRDIKLARLPLVPMVHGGELRELVTRQMERPDVALAPLLFRLFIANRWMQRFNIAPIA